MNVIFEFIEKPYSLRINSQSDQRIQTANYDIEKYKNIV